MLYNRGIYFERCLYMEKIEEIKKIVIDKLSCSAHDLNHTFRVYNNCLRIAKTLENIDLEVLKYASLLHDIARTEEDRCQDGSIDHAILGSEEARKILEKFEINENIINHVCSAIRSHRYRNGIIPDSIEAKILFDADKLDIIGNIGLCRSYMIAGEYNQNIFNEYDLDQYIKDNLVGGVANGRVKDMSLHSPNIEFQLKDIYLPDKMFTEEGKRIAQKRIIKMESFFKELDKEIKGID